MRHTDPEAALGIRETVGAAVGRSFRDFFKKTSSGSRKYKLGRRLLQDGHRLSSSEQNLMGAIPTAGSDLRTDEPPQKALQVEAEERAAPSGFSRPLQDLQGLLLPGPLLRHSLRESLGDQAPIAPKGVGSVGARGGYIAPSTTASLARCRCNYRFLLPRRSADTARPTSTTGCPAPSSLT